MPLSSAASRSGLPHHSTNRSVSSHHHDDNDDDDDDDGAWDEASDDDDERGGEDALSARLGAISLKKGTVSPIQTNLADKPLSDQKKSPSSATSASTWSFNPFSMRPSAARPSHASTSSSLFGGPFSASSSSATTSAASPPSNSIPAPSALYAYPRAAAPSRSFSSSSAAATGEAPPTSPSRQASTASAAPIVSPSLGAEAVAAALSGRPSLPLHHHHGGRGGVALRDSSTRAAASPAASTAAAAAADPPPRPTRGASYLAGASRVQAEADRCVSEQEEQKKRRESNGAGGGDSAAEQEPAQSGQGGNSSRRRSGSSSVTGGGGGDGSDDKEPGSGDGYAKEQYRRAVRKDVADLVRDPAHVLARLKVAWRPRPPAAPPSPHHVHPTMSSSLAQHPGRSRNGPVPTETIAGRPPSSSSESPSRASHAAVANNEPDSEAAEDDNDDDGEEGPPLTADDDTGYVNLNAPSISSREATLLAGIHSPETVVVPPDPEEEGEKGRENRRKRKFLQVLEGGEQGVGVGGGENVDLAELRKLAWSGVPNELRPMVWQLLLGYLPAPTARRAATLARKRSEYASLVKQAFSRGVKGLDGPLWHQISIDVPRTRPGVPLWQAEATQRSLERVLYVWAIRHPASGYVQGINDLVTPFFQVFLASYIDADPETFDVSVLAPEVLEALEADSFWCLSKLLDGIQDNYIFAQPGIQRLVKKMETLCGRVDAPLAAHLKEQGVEFIQFAFRWMNCLLMRELSVKNIVRMWDTYLAEGGDAFSEFHLYVCLAFLVRWSDQLREMDFQSIIMFLQSLPTQNWSDKDTELLLSEAFMWSRTFVAR